MSPTTTGEDRLRRDRVTGPAREVPDRFGAPPLPHGVVIRHRLVDTLERGTEGRLTLVSAPAGTGKTVTVASWVAHGRRPGPVVWVTLSPSNAEPAALWSVLVDGLRSAGVPVSGRVPLTASGAAEPVALGALAARIAEHPEPVVLVLDCDTDLGPVAADGLRDLLHDSAGQLRLVVVTRADPPLPLHRYALDGSLTQLRLSDLAFSEDEARDLLHRRGVELPAGVFEVVMARTRGWVAGLLLAAMSLIPMRDRERAAREFTGASGTVAEYLLSEVLDAQSPLARDLLLRTSVVEVLRPGLAEALAGPKAPRALEVLARGNAFLEPVPDRLGWFRYHPLFRELLHAQLRYESPETADRLHLVAAEWAAAEGLLDEAVRHAVAAGEDGRAARFVVDDLALVDVLVRTAAGLAPVSGGLAAFVQTVRTEGHADRSVRFIVPDGPDGAACALVRAVLAVSERDADGAALLLQTAHERIAAGEAEDVTPWPAGHLAESIVGAALAMLRGDQATALRMLDESEHLLAAQDLDRVVAHPEVVTWLSAIRAEALLADGRLTEAADSLEAAVATKSRPGLELLHVESLGRLSLLAARAGRVRRAVRLAEQALEVRREAGLLPGTGTAAAQVALAWANVEAYDLAAARRHAHAATEEGPEGSVAASVWVSTSHDTVADPTTGALLVLVQARIRRAHGDLDGARALLEDALAEADGAPEWVRDHLLLDEAMIDVLHGRPDAAAVLDHEVGEPARGTAELVRAQDRISRGEGLDDPVVAPEQADESLPVLVDLWLLESLRRLRRGDEHRAAEALERSLSLAAPEQLRRPFREAPTDVRRLLRIRPELARRHRWLAAESGARRPTSRAASTVDHPGATLVVEALTQKEREVLAHLAELLTTEEIAGAMFVSVNTVRTHVRNILRKLGVSRRNEAIRRARELQLL